MKRILKLLLLLLLLIGGPVSMPVAAVHAQTRTEDPDSGLKQKLLTLEGVTAVERLSSNKFNEKYLVTITQPLDHARPEAGTFSQRFVVSHIGFDAPTVIVTEGYRGDYGLNPNYREEISERYNTNMVFVEHRFFSGSTPRPRDWQYLTARNSAYDLHRINQAMKQIYAGKWISTGISKGGQTTIIYKTFFPDDVDIAVPYVAPVCFGVEDGRHEPFIRKCGTAEDRDRILAFQREVLTRRAEMLPLLDSLTKANHLRYNMSLSEVLDYMVLEYPFALWQWGTARTTIPAGDAAANQLFRHLIGVVGNDYFAVSGEPSFFVQAAKELGYYGYDTRPLKDLLTIKTTKGYLNRIFLPGDAKLVKFDPTLHKQIYNYLKKNDPKMIMIYGQYDPWSAAGVEDKILKGKRNMTKVVQPNGSHRARIGTLPAEQADAVWDQLDRWIKE